MRSNLYTSLGFRWCGWRDLNPHALRHLDLNQACLPFHHTRAAVQISGAAVGVNERIKRVTKTVTPVTTKVTNPSAADLEAPTKQGADNSSSGFRFRGIKSPRRDQHANFTAILNEIRAFNAHVDEQLALQGIVPLE